MHKVLLMFVSQPQVSGSREKENAQAHGSGELNLSANQHLLVFWGNVEEAGEEEMNSWGAGAKQLSPGSNLIECQCPVPSVPPEGCASSLHSEAIRYYFPQSR